MGSRRRPGGVGRWHQGGVRKNRCPTVMGGQASRVACAQSIGCSSRSSGASEVKRCSRLRSSKNARTPPSSSIMPVVPHSQSSAIRYSSRSGDGRKKRENIQLVGYRLGGSEAGGSPTLLRGGGYLAGLFGLLHGDVQRLFQ